MRTNFFLACLLTIQGTSFAIADGSIPSACRTIFGAAKSAIANKRDHVPEAKLRAALPPRSVNGATSCPELAELALSLNEIVDDVYSEYDVEPTTYATYKAEVCVRRLAHKAVPASFRSVQPRLAACAKQPPNEAIECAMTVAGSKEGDDGS